MLTRVAPAASIPQSLSLLADPAWQRSSTPVQLAAWLELLRAELAGGALGIGVLMGCAPRSDPAEYLAVAQLAAESGVPTYTHVRELVEADPTTPIDGVQEVVRAAAETRAAMHHRHVNSTSRRHIDQVLSTLSRAQQGDHESPSGPIFMARVVRRSAPSWLWKGECLGPDTFVVGADRQRGTNSRRRSAPRGARTGSGHTVRRGILERERPGGSGQARRVVGLPGQHRGQ